MNYTPEQLKRRNASVWTPVQGITAPLQFLAFLGSAVFVVRYLLTGAGFDIAHVLSVVKVTLMIFMTVTGMLWEHEVYGKYFLAKEFFWEDFVNLVSLIAHLAFIAAWVFGLSETIQMIVMGIALLTYLVNFVQFGARGIRAAKQRRQAKMAQQTQTLVAE
jgi:3-vinyl bacteriochlorophyllide hydratase